MSEPDVTPRRTWFDHGVIALALVLLLTGFTTIVDGRDWWVTTILVAALTGLTCAVMRAVGARLVAPAALLVAFIAITWIFVPETLLAVVPTPSTFSALADLGSSAREIIAVEQAPVAAARPIVLVVAASFALIVVVADLMLQRRRAAPLIGALLLAVFATPALISGVTPPVWLFLAVAALWLVLLRSRTATPVVGARTGLSPAVAMGAAALAAAVAFPVVAPDVSAVAASWGKPPPTVFGRGINPMIELGQNLRRNSTATALTYSTTFDEAQYLKVATLRDFTGRTWRPASTERGDRYEGAGLDIDPDIVRQAGTTTITIDNLRSPLLPTPYPATGAVSGLGRAWNFERAGMTLVKRDGDSRGETYTVASVDIQPTAEQMRRLPARAGRGQQSYLDLPRSMPPIIAATAREVTADADTDYDRALALQKFFRDGDFRYSETAPVAGDYDGNGVDVIAEFLREKAGYCVHFSSAMAVMARTLDMPSRIAVGYAPGTSGPLEDGERIFTNTSDDLHAWTEIYFEGAGWVRFDPTTSIGSATRFEEPVSNTPDATPTPVPDQQQQSTPQQRPDTVDDGAGAAPAQESSTAPRSAIVTVAALLLVGALPWLVRLLRRRWRLTRGRDDVEPLWRELEDVARDLRIPASAGDTPRGFADRLAREPGVDETALDALLRRVERSRFSRGEQPDGDGVADLEAVTSSLLAGASTRRRLLATLLPQSLAGRTPVAPAVAPATLAG